MKKVVTINIAGRSFYIDEDAFDVLGEYLKKLNDWSQKKEGGKEILTDIESRIRELFEDRIEPATGVISINMVNDVIHTMGQPEDFSDDPADDETNEEEKARAGHFSADTRVPPRRRLYRDVEDRVLGGVCSGIAAYFNIDRVVVRILFAILPFLSFGAIIPIYIILWIAIPPALTSSQRLEMQGHDVNISNIEKNIRDEYNSVKQKFQKSTAYKKGEDYLGRFRKRDRTALIVTAVVIGFIFVFNFFRIPHELGLAPAFHLNMPFMHMGFPPVLPILLILLILGLAFRSAFKGFLILIVIVLLGTLLFRMLGFFAWPSAMHPFM